MAHTSSQPADRGAWLLGELGGLTDATHRDLGSADLTAIQTYLNGDLYAFARVIFGYKDLDPRLHGEIGKWIGMWGLVQVQRLGETPWIPHTDLRPSDIVVGDFRRLMTQIPREMFKCLRKSSIVSTTYGPKLVEDLKVGDTLWALDATLKLRENQILATRSSTAPLLKVTLKSGLTFEATPNHPLRTVLGWQELRTLTPGAGIATARQIPAPHRTPTYPYTAGAICGDGCAGNQSLTCFDNEILDGIRAEGVEVRYRKSIGTYGIPTTVWQQTEISGRAETKRIPDQYEGSGQFLSGLFDTDGTVGVNQGKVKAIVLVTTSEGLCRDVSRNLRYFGIVCRFKRYRSQGPNNFRGWVWHLTITGKHNAEAFQKYIGFRVPRKALRLQALIDTTPDGRTSSRAEAVPPEWREFIHRSRRGRNLDGTYGGGESAKLNAAGMNVDNNCWSSRDKVQHAATLLNRPDIASLASPDVAWDEIKSIEQLPDGEIVELEVDGNHAYIGDCVLHHNTSMGTIANGLWQICREPHLPVAIFNERLDNVAKKALGSIRQVVQGNKLFQDIYRDLLPPGVHYRDSKSMPRSWKWNDFELDFEGKRLGESEYSLSAHGVESAAVGGHWPKIILDDLIGERQKVSNAEMERSREFIKGHVYLMRPAENSMVYVNCTPWTYRDVYYDLLANYNYKLYRRSALELPDGTPDVDNGESIFPAKLSTRQLKSMYARDANKGDAAVFWAQMMCVPKAGSDQSFSQDWVRYGLCDPTENEPVFYIEAPYYSKDVGWVTADGDKPTQEVPLRLMHKAIILDPAPSERTAQSKEPRARNAIIVEGLDCWGRRFLLETWAKRADYTETISKCFELSQKWHTDRLFVEEVNFSTVYRHWIAREQRPDGHYKDSHLAVQPLSPKGREKDTRILSRTASWQAGLYYVNRGLCNQFLTEFAEYPHSSTRDLLDCMGYDADPGVLTRPESGFELKLRRYREHKMDEGRDTVTRY